MPVTLLVTFRARPDSANTLAGMLAQAVNRGPMHPDCLQAVLYRNASDPLELLLVESWTSAAAHEAFYAASEADGALDVLRPYMESMSIRTLQDI